jgi:hypothetical protein
MRTEVDTTGHVRQLAFSTLGDFVIDFSARRGVQPPLHISLADERSFIVCHFDCTSVPDNDCLHNGYCCYLDILCV